MKSTKNHFLSIFLLISILVLVAGYFLNNSKPNLTSTTTISSAPNLASPPIQEKTIKFSNIYYSTRKDNNLYIYQYNGEKNQLIFTDSDEKEKISNILGVEDGKLYLLMGYDSTKNLYSVPVDSNGNKTIEINNLNKDAITIGKGRIAYTEYSNAEKDFGYKIFTSSINGSNKAEVASESLNPFSLKIINNYLYYVIDRSNVFEIYSIDLSTNDKKLFTEINTKPNQYEITGDHLIYSSDKKLMKYDMTKKSYTDLMIGSPLNSFKYLDKYLFFSKDGKIYSNDGKQSVEITSGEILIDVN